MFFAQKTTDFGPKNRLRIWGESLPPPLRTKFSARKGLRIWGVPPPPPFTDKIRKVVFDLAPYYILLPHCFVRHVPWLYDYTADYSLLYHYQLSVTQPSYIFGVLNCSNSHYLPATQKVCQNILHRFFVFVICHLYLWFYLKKSIVEPSVPPLTSAI